LSTRNRKRYSLLVEREGSTNLERITIGGTALKIGGSLIVTGLVMLMLLGVFALSEYRVRQRTGKLIAENRLLGYQLTQVQDRLGEVVNRVDSLAREEEAIRVRVNLPPLGEDVRKAGVGSSMPYEGQVIGDERIENLLRSLDQVERELTVQRQSYAEIREKLITDEKRLKHVPSIIPLNTGRMTDAFGYRRDPFTHQIRFHYGVDFSSPTGTPVYSTADGTVTKAHRVPGFGKVVEVDHGYGYTTVYGHMDEYIVRRGQRLKRGDQIGSVGNTGRSTASHLHYEVRVKGRPVDPLDYFYEGYQLWAGR
jgi:murein DD-endopeptidase MepM/ murein hydrolase activator NlpD